MKKIITVLVSIFVLSSVGYCQRSSLGITFGTGLGWMSNSGQHLVNKQSSNVGATYMYSSNKHFGFGVDVKYSREGFKYTYSLTDIFGNIRRNMDARVSSDFIRVPIRAIYFFNDNTHRFRPNVSFGPSFGFLTGGKILNEDSDRTLYSKSLVKDSFKGFDFGLQGTLGVSFKITEKLWLSGDIAYYQGLLKQNKFGTNNMLNSNLVLNLGVRIGIGN